MADALGTLITAVRQAVRELGLGDEVEVVVAPSARPEFGDYSTPVPLRAARFLKRPPVEIAERLRASLDAASLDLVAEWTTSAGYVNARLRDDVWVPQVLARARALDVDRPLDIPSEFAAPHGKVLVEHTATNPNKAAHVGHLRNACIGDSVARMLARTGQRLEVNNYIDDTGVQVADVAVGIRDLGILQREGEPYDQYCSRVYVEVSRRSDEDPALLERRNTILHDIELGDAEIGPFVKAIATRVVECHLATMGRFGIGYDLLTWESDIIALGFWKRAFELLRDNGAIVLATDGKFRGCWVMPADATGDADEEDDTKVLVKSNGIATYTAKDIAYQLWKFGLLGLDFHYRPWSVTGRPPATTSSRETPDALPPVYGRAREVINVIDSRQAYPQHIVQRALRRLGYEQEANSSIHLAYEVVALSASAARELDVDGGGGSGVQALSGRRGIEVRADDLLDRTIARLSGKAADERTARDVAAGAIRYYLLKFTLNQRIAFDFEEALRVNGDTGVYVQYAHARAMGILRKVDEDTGELVIPPRLEPVERALVHRIDAYAREVLAAAQALSPSLLTTYAYSLASTLSDFYEHTAPVVREDDPMLRRFRRALVAAAAATLADALRTLGIAALERI